MKANDILNKIKNIVGVELSEETVDTEMEEHEDKKEEKEEMKYVTREEFALAMDELKSMIEAMDHKKKKEEMSEEAQETKEELSAETVEPIKHNPEAEQNNKVNFKISGNRQTTTMDRVYSKIFNNN